LEIIRKLPVTAIVIRLWHIAKLVIAAIAIRVKIIIAAERFKEEEEE